MDLNLHKSKVHASAAITITGSKSESNRLLLMQALWPKLEIENLSNSDDSVLMQKAIQSHQSLIDIHHAGTAMRFLTAYYATQEGREVVLTGSERMQERPIQILVEALQTLGATISYENKEGYPPLRIKGQALTKAHVTMAANVSSQYISALLLIGSKLPNGLELTLEGTITSVPYIKMTLSLLNQLGVETVFEEQTIRVKPLASPQVSKPFVVESDWSSASYYYSIVALSAVGTTIQLSAYKQNSLQGDSVLARIYEQLGVQTRYEAHSITLVKTAALEPSHLEVDLSNAPDIAQTIAVSCLALGWTCHLTGLHTLKIKETDRLLALKTEIEKLGTSVHITDDSLEITAPESLKIQVSIRTYNDHRMAMAFAPLALRTDLIIEDSGVVSKSYPDFWKHMEAIGFQLSE